MTRPVEDPRDDASEPIRMGLLAFLLVFSLAPAAGGLVRMLELAGGPAIAPLNREPSRLR